VVGARVDEFGPSLTVAFARFFGGRRYQDPAVEVPRRRRLDVPDALLSEEPLSCSFGRSYERCPREPPQRPWQFVGGVVVAPPDYSAGASLR